MMGCRCQRCGEEFSISFGGNMHKPDIKIEATSHIGKEFIELCNKCWEESRKFMEGKKK